MNNIVFGGTFDEVWYEQVLQATCLAPDLDLMPAGDQLDQALAVQHMTASSTSFFSFPPPPS